MSERDLFAIAATEGHLPEIALERDPEALSLEETRQAVRFLRADRERLKHEATHDSKLTSMLNPGETLRRVEGKIDAGKMFGVFFVDINNFKRYNDKYKHVEGDDLLFIVERLFNETFQRKGDETEIGRIGGDEFLLIMVDLGKAAAEYEGNQRTNDPYQQMDNIYELLRVIERKLLELEPRAVEVGVGFSIGPALFDPANPVDARTLIGQADEAMYEEKPEDARRSATLDIL